MLESANLWADIFMIFMAARPASAKRRARRPAFSLLQQPWQLRCHMDPHGISSYHGMCTVCTVMVKYDSCCGAMSFCNALHGYPFDPFWHIVTMQKGTNVGTRRLTCRTASVKDGLEWLFSTRWGHLESNSLWFQVPGEDGEVWWGFCVSIPRLELLQVLPCWARLKIDKIASVFVDQSEVTATCATCATCATSRQSANGSTWSMVLDGPWPGAAPRPDVRRDRAASGRSDWSLRRWNSWHLTP